ncbi:right-handed parallel beta-helix repeat-containing protein [Spirosoma oryzicola]|uniref:right-handed parallel beta-helix repeat-containing protein n=1 Tax=Spirosoma oryzicola TaxID=2898794 RepID=UPI001E3C721D|nr:right-handed parallel beta-helix repeat-containing protein [Spirosoma oryzicola]UHG93747.1 right-handed parallel beta-helix repeat-containing protein [Spirosoma oryzicola]
MGIYGGFAGSETSLASCPPVNPVAGQISSTTLTVSGSGRVIDNPSGLTNTSVLDGVIVAGGNATNGGGMYNFSSSPSLVNCSFQDNSAQYGGGMYNLSGLPNLINCSFQSNTAGDGGGMYNLSSNASLINCSFQDKSASTRGGGMVVNGYNPSLTNCSFQGNTADSGGAIYNISDNPLLTDCVLFNNGGANTLVNISGGSVQASYSLFDDTVTGFTDGGKNLRTRVSPFQNATGPQLSICAPTIDAGDNAANTTTTDVLGNARKVRTIDIGAAEFQGAAYVAPALSTISQSATAVCAGTFVSFTLYAAGGSQGIKAGSLYRGNTNLGDADVSVAPGSAFGFTRVFPLHRSGTYQIVLTSQYTSLTTTFAPITVNPLPTQYAVTGGGTYCQGSKVPAVGLSGSQMDVTYQLLRGTTPVGDSVAGTGSAISFGNQTGEGTFTVLATNVSTSCQRTISGSQSVTEKPTPAPHTLVTQSGGLYPAGVSSLTIAQNTGDVILMASGCQDGTINWNGGSNSTLAVSTANLVRKALPLPLPAIRMVAPVLSPQLPSR